MQHYHMRREDYKEREIQSFITERYKQEHSLSDEDLEMDALIRKMPIEVIKFRIPKS